MGKRKHAEIDTIPLFEEPPHVTFERPKSIRSVARGYCPGHMTEKKTGLIRQGTHLYWREHFVTTWWGIRRPCRCSGAVLHAAPAQVVGVDAAPVCPCGGVD